MTATPLISVRNLVKEFPVRRGLFTKRQVKVAVDGVSFDIQQGTTFALVGESGSGKTTVGLMVLDLLPPTRGEVLYAGEPIHARKGRERLALRRQMQVVFQDPYASLNARMTVAEALTEGMMIHRIGASARERRERAAELLRQVNLPPEALDRYPHEFSGGQRQRIAIARALSVEPGFIVLDEPTSALDVSVQSQVLNLLRQLQQDLGLTYLFITHNLDVVGYMADEVAVMERGRIVERGTVDEIFDNPQQEYTRRLLAAVPSVEAALR
ncbi:MAG: ATP-binding cassette domain-containing protein [Chloroherpetonaceae bacterium]|nr:ATP-binding cassette domain-containing protein [Chthonomonadaceae bacterium]MDW8208563.1 ATP-binding cassette domain-containing protein [Chloroherpetonaceae bacterium]